MMEVAFQRANRPIVHCIVYVQAEQLNHSCNKR